MVIVSVTMMRPISVPESPEPHVHGVERDEGRDRRQCNRQQDREQELVLVGKVEAREDVGQRQHHEQRHDRDDRRDDEAVAEPPDDLIGLA